MHNWIMHPTSLAGHTVDLIPLEIAYFTALEAMARDKRIWEFYIYDGSDPAVFLKTLESALSERENGNQYPFVIFHRQDQKIIGATRLMDIQPRHKKLEIGSTWLHPDYWGTAVNLECKLLLLTHCFENLKATRVQLKTDENNLRSRKAIEKIGGQFEGILRHDMIRDNGTHRNSAYYSIIDTAWEKTKQDLVGLYEAKRDLIH